MSSRSCFCIWCYQRGARALSSEVHNLSCTLEMIGIYKILMPGAWPRPGRLNPPVFCLPRVFFLKAAWVTSAQPGSQTMKQAGRFCLRTTVP